MILAGDVGATKVLLEAGDVDEGRWKPFLARRYAITDFSGMPALLEVFLDEWKAAKPSRARLTAGAIGVAGPAEDNCVQMTHRPWIVDGDALGDQFAIPRLRVVNDLMATASGIEMLSSRDFYTLQAGKAVAGAPQVILGVGTGLGVAYRINPADAPHKNRDRPSFSPSEKE
ncbi:MAG: glucokinase, partial [Usitatibacter sp.]